MRTKGSQALVSERWRACVFVCREAQVSNQKERFLFMFRMRKCACVCVFVSQRERERGRKRVGEIEN